MTNVENTTDKQPASGARFTITATLDGFPIAVELEGKADNLRGMIDRLKAIGAEPPVSSIESRIEPTNATPTCPVHHSEMKSGRRGFFCPKKVGDDYCKETA